MAEPTVLVEAIEIHSYHGVAYDVGDTYDADAGDVDSLAVQGKATRVAPRKSAAVDGARGVAAPPARPVTRRTTRPAPAPVTRKAKAKTKVTAKPPARRRK